MQRKTTQLACGRFRRVFRLSGKSAASTDGKGTASDVLLTRSNRVQLHSQNSTVPLKVLIGGENLPIAARCRCTNQKINRRPSDPPCATAVVHLGRLLVIPGF